MALQVKPRDEATLSASIWALDRAIPAGLNLCLPEHQLERVWASVLVYYPNTPPPHLHTIRAMDLELLHKSTCQQVRSQLRPVAGGAQPGKGPMSSERAQAVCPYGDERRSGTPYALPAMPCTLRLGHAEGRDPLCKWLPSDRAGAMLLHVLPDRFTPEGVSGRSKQWILQYVAGEGAVQVSGRRRCEEVNLAGRGTRLALADARGDVGNGLGKGTEHLCVAVCIRLYKCL